MKKANMTKTTGKIIVKVLVASLIMQAFIFGLSAVSAVDNSKTQNSLDEMAALITSTNYVDYLTRYSEIERGSADITINAIDYDKELTKAEVSVISDVDGIGSDSLLTPEEGEVVYTVDIPSEGMYNLEFTYYPYEGKSAAIERIILIDGKVPFKEARYLAFSRVWKDNYISPGERVFKLDINGNEIRPTKNEDPRWMTYILRDSSSFFSEPLLFYFDKGIHHITIDASREPLLLNNIRIYSADSLPFYSDVLEQYEAKGYKPASTDAVVKIDAEIPYATSEQVIYPVNDRTSAITDPQHTSNVYLNTIGGDKWQIANQWIEWEFEVPEDGLYHIVPRFKQSINAGLFSSRSLKIDGEYPFEEAKFFEFNFSDDWQVSALGNDENTFLFYLEKGNHVLQMEVVLGNMADYLRQIDESLIRMNEYYRKILMITGPSPDTYLDYDFAKLIPEVLRGMRYEADLLTEISNGLEDIIGQKGENSVLLDKIAYLLDIMGHDQDKVAVNLSTYKSYIGSLGTWLLSARNQPLAFDYIMVQSPNANLPKAKAGFFESAWHEIRSFVMSFFADYNSLGAVEKIDEEDPDTVEVWVTTGRDQAQIMRQMIDDSFTQKRGIPVNLKLIAEGTLLPATLAGVGPDVSMDADPVGYGIRSAAIPLNDFDGFEEVKTWFNPESLVPLTIYDPKREKVVTYGLPNQQNFPMLFYRKDVFVELGLSVPETWDDIYDIIRALSEKNMEMGLSQAVTQILMYQQNEPWYNGHTQETVGVSTNLDSNKSLDAFKTMCEFFTMYRQPVAYDFANRFRTGEMPIGIADYTLYNQLTVFAPEIRGLWEFVQLPGMPMEDGTINHTSPLSVQGVMMMRDAKNPQNAWEFLRWWVSAEAQARFGNEQVAIMGTAAKYNTANIEALEAQPWSAQEMRNLRQQFASLRGTPMTPGNYIVGRNTNFAFYSVYNDGQAPSEAMLSYIDDINKELTRKRDEYDFITIDQYNAQYGDSELS